MGNPLAFLDIWRVSQDAMNDELRWKHWLEGNVGIRKQTALQYSFSSALLLDWVLVQLSCLLVPQKGLLKRACLIQAWADAELRRPFDLIHREPRHDLEDFLAFEARFHQLDEGSYNMFRQAFLLQFVGNPSFELFDPSEREVLRDLQERCSLERALLAFVRGIGHFYYAIDELREHGDPGVLREVLRNTLTEMNSLAARIPDANLIIWRELREKALKMAETGQFIA